MSSGVITPLAGYANPQAATGVGTTSLSYDRAGNVATASSWTYYYDYQNRLATSTNGIATTTYTYLPSRLGAEANDRVTQKDAISTVYTYYISPGYETVTEGVVYNPAESITKHVYLGDLLVADIVTDQPLLSRGGGGPTQRVHYMNDDHLVGPTTVIDEDGFLEETLDYYPYGSLRLKEQIVYDTPHKFAGSVHDTNTELNYMNARYYQGSRGQFISQDPMFWQLPSALLADPQQLNSYSYARNNPLIYKDPLGLYSIKTGAVEKGDTLSKIRGLINGANETNYSIKQIADLNGISNPDRIYVGQTLKPNSSVPDITRSLNSVNQSHGAQAQGPVVAGSGASNSTPAAKGIGSVEFGWNFREGGKWDLKSQGSSVEGGVFCQKSSCGGQRATSYVYDAQEVLGDAPGNIHYGYVGKRAGYSESTLLFFGGAVQTITHPGQFGDPSSDKTYIIQGYGLNY